MVISPVIIQRTSIHAGDPMSWSIIDDTINIPDPIMDPATKRVASKRPSFFSDEFKEYYFQQSICVNVNSFDRR